MIKLSREISIVGACLVFAGSLLAGQQALASVWEQITQFATNGSTTSDLLSRSTVLSGWKVQTTEPYYEYRSLYYTSSTSDHWSEPEVWQEYTQCRREGIVNGSTEDTCSHSVPYEPPGAVVPYAFRASTQYATCGAWTPTPDELNCGHTQTTVHNIIP